MYEYMYLLILDQDQYFDDDTPNDAKKIISIYELNKAQLVFTLAKQNNDGSGCSMTLINVSAQSQIMFDVGVHKRGEISWIIWLLNSLFFCRYFN